MVELSDEIFADGSLCLLKYRITDYGHMKTKSLIQIPIPTKYLAIKA